MENFTARYYFDVYSNLLTFHPPASIPDTFDWIYSPMNYTKTNQINWSSSILYFKNPLALVATKSEPNLKIKTHALSIPLWIYHLLPQLSSITLLSSPYIPFVPRNLRKNIVRKTPPASLTHRWTFACFDRLLQHEPFISSAEKGSILTATPLFFNVSSCLSGKNEWQ